MQYPNQIKTVHAEMLEGELCIYDWQRSKVHTLNTTAGLVWQMCDGETGPEQMVERLRTELKAPQAEELVWLSLKELQEARLISMPAQEAAGPKQGLNRRQLLKGLGVAAALLPMISSIVTPGPVEAQSACLPGGNTFNASVPKTGQTASFATGDDGDLERGVAWPSPRFTDNGDGTVTDNLTGLIWLTDANYLGGAQTWANALTACNNLAAGTGGLSDGSAAGDWRLPNVRELSSLTDFSRQNPALPAGHPFTNVQTTIYWSSTTYTPNPSRAWVVSMVNGVVNAGNKTATFFVWPVRGGQ